MDGLTFRFSRFEEFPKLIAMWRACFLQEAKAASHVFLELQRAENILVGVISGEPVTMLSLREFSLTSPMKSCKAAYIYGVATFPEHQGKGYGKALMQNADALLTHRKFACAALVPAGEKLFEFYEKLGYETAFQINKVSFEAAEVSDGEVFKLEPISAGQLAIIRDARFSDSKMFVRWDEEYLSYIVSESEFYGGGAFMFTCGGKQIYAICHRDGDTVYVKELAATLATLETALRSIQAHFLGTQKFILYLREDVQIPYTNSLLPFGMIKWYDENAKNEMSGAGGPAYIANVLD